MEQQKEAEQFFNELSSTPATEMPDNGRSKISVQYIEESKEDKPQETQEPEKVVEPVQENLNHLINEDGSIKMEATDEQMKKLGVDNPASYRYFQSQLDKTRAQDSREREELRREIETLKTQSTPQKEEVLAPPQKPSSDDPIEKMEYLAKMVEYQNKVIEGVSKNFQAEQQKRQQIEQEAQQKAYITGQLVSAGASPEEAGEIINGLASLQRDANSYAKFIVQSWRGNKQPTLQNQQKTNAVDGRLKQQGQVLPLGVIPSPSENKPPKQDFWGDLGEYSKKH